MCNLLSTPCVTTPCLAGQQSGMAIDPSTQRLYDALAGLPTPIGRKSATAAALNESPQTINNWEARGVSVPGAIKAQRMYGISALWVLHNEPPATVHGASQALRLTHEMIAAALRMARGAADVTGGGDDFDIDDPLDAELFAEAIGDVIEHGVTDVSDGDVLRVARKVNQARGKSDVRKRQGGKDGGAGGGTSQEEAGGKSKPAPRRVRKSAA